MSKPETVLPIAVELIVVMRFYRELIIADSPPPDARLRESIRAHGLFEPVIIRPYRSKYKVIAGNRRLRAIAEIATDEERNLDEQPIPCIVVEDADRALAAMTATNNLRRANPLTDLAAILDLQKRLIKKGLNVREIEREISKTLGITAARQRSLLELEKLAPQFRMGMIEGALALSTARQILKLDAYKQKKLASQLDEAGRITAKDVAAHRKAATMQLSESLPWEQINPTSEVIE